MNPTDYTSRQKLLIEKGMQTSQFCTQLHQLLRELETIRQQNFEFNQVPDFANSELGFLQSPQKLQDALDQIGLIFASHSNHILGAAR